MSKDRTSDSLACALIDFNTFWDAYPNKVARKAAFKAWEKAKDRPHIADILNALQKAKQSKQWTKDNGEFIPHPATWINSGRWDDHPTPREPTVMEKFLARHREDA